MLNIIIFIYIEFVYWFRGLFEQFCGGMRWTRWVLKGAWLGILVTKAGTATIQSGGIGNRPTAALTSKPLPWQRISQVSPCKDTPRARLDVSWLQRRPGILWVAGRCVWHWPGAVAMSGRYCIPLPIHTAINKVLAVTETPDPSQTTSRVSTCPARKIEALMFSPLPLQDPLSNPTNTRNIPNFDLMLGLWQIAAMQWKNNENQKNFVWY